METRPETATSGPFLGPSAGPVVVAYDDSEPARAALQWAIELARLAGAEVVVVHVISSVVEWELSAAQIDTDARRRARTEDLNTHWTQPLRDAGVKYRTELRTGKAAEEIERVATQSAASLIVVGMSERSGVSELWMGGPAHTLVHDAPCPVVSVPVQSA